MLQSDIVIQPPLSSDLKVVSFVSGGAISGRYVLW